MKHLLYGLVLSFAWAVFAWSGLTQRDSERMNASSDALRVRLPLVVQLAYSGGDPFLAANLNVFRSLMVDPRVTELETYRVQAQLQQDASFFNPWHEDNYYVGAAILPWNGQIDAAQLILLRGSNARHWDMWPPFFYAFNAMYFEHDMRRAGHWAEVAATRHPGNAGALRSMAAAWYEREDDPQIAINILQAMHEQSRDENFRALLEARISRLHGLMALRKAADEYRTRHGAAAGNLGMLIGYAGLASLPVDPLKLGYVMDKDGQPQLADHKRTAEQP